MTNRTLALAAATALAVGGMLAAPCTLLAQDSSQHGSGAGTSGQAGSGMGQSGAGQSGMGQSGVGQADRQGMQDTMQAIRSADSPDKLFLIEAAMGSQAEM